MDAHTHRKTLPNFRRVCYSENLTFKTSGYKFLTLNQSILANGVLGAKLANFREKPFIFLTFGADGNFCETEHN